jgi:hypothetical protein
MMKMLVKNLLVCAVLVFPMANARPARADKQSVNACGCYRDNGSCFCQKKAKCGCPGECEPKGCEEARQKEFQKEIEAATKQAKEQEEKARAESKDQGKPAAKDDDSGAAAPGKEGAPAAKEGKSPPVHHMTAREMLLEVRGQL